MPDYQLLIFDWDGTLVDSIGRIVEAMHRAADVGELPRCSDAEVRGIIGLELGHAICTLYPELDEPARIEAIRRAYSEQYLLLEREPSPLYEGVSESLAWFRDQGYQLAVATGKGRNGLQRVLADKRQDGIISENVVGAKHRGYLDIDYKMPVLGGTITKW